MYEAVKIITPNKDFFFKAYKSGKIGNKNGYFYKNVPKWICINKFMMEFNLLRYSQDVHRRVWKFYGNYNFKQLEFFIDWQGIQLDIPHLPLLSIRELRRGIYGRDIH